MIARPLHASDTDPVAKIRLLWVEAVADQAAIAEGLRLVEASRTNMEPGSSMEAVLEAYGGALVTLNAKHAVWPPTRLRHLRDGLAILDREVRENPDHPEIRYLRLMSCYYLPGLLGRGWSVREDFAALARLLPDVRESYPAELFRAITTFVLENGGLGAAERAPLESALERLADG